MNNYLNYYIEIILIFYNEIIFEILNKLTIKSKRNMYKAI